MSSFLKKGRWTKSLTIRTIVSKRMTFFMTALQRINFLSSIVKLKIGCLSVSYSFTRFVGWESLLSTFTWISSMSHYINTKKKHKTKKHKTLQSLTAYMKTTNTSVQLTIIIIIIIVTHSSREGHGQPFFEKTYGKHHFVSSIIVRWFTIYIRNYRAS